MASKFSKVAAKNSIITVNLWIEQFSFYFLLFVKVVRFYKNIYILLSIYGAIIGGASVISILGALGTTGWTEFAFSGLSIVGIIVFILILFLIGGYTLDIIKFGIERRPDGPGIDIGRQISNTIKLIVVDVVYYVVPAIIVFVLGLFLRNWLMSIISIT